MAVLHPSSEHHTVPTEAVRTQVQVDIVDIGDGSQRLSHPAVSVLPNPS